MNEGYLIVNATNDNLKQVELLVHSIKKIDKSRPIIIASCNTDLKTISGITDIVTVENVDNKVLQYFKCLLASPLDKTIALLPDQILTEFNVDVWESLRGMGPIVIPEKKLNFAGDRIWPSAYWMDSMEEKTFGHASVINAIYLDQACGARDVLGLAIDICSSYQQQEFLTWVKQQSDLGESLSLPIFPEFLWEQWILSFLRTVLQEKIRQFDFVNCIDLSIQENNFWNPIWSKEAWNKFLTYWVTDKSEIKIENFIQKGLIKYQHAGWLSEENLTLLKA